MVGTKLTGEFWHARHLYNSAVVLRREKLSEAPQDALEQYHLIPNQAYGQRHEQDR